MYGNCTGMFEASGMEVNNLKDISVELPEVVDIESCKIIFTERIV